MTVPQYIAEPDKVTFSNNATVEEYVGRVATKTDAVSVTILGSPVGWVEPVQTPEFDEISLVLTGALLVESGGETFEVGEGQAIVVKAGETIQYSAPKGARYLSVCMPAFDLPLTNRADWSTVGG
jgi:mannose-6-phosphate isomerase-like protein (cupin superfamily)